MSNPLTVFHDKDAADRPWSMTRVVNFMMAVSFCYTLLAYANKAVPINWPFTILGFGILGAVPLVGLLSYLGDWIASRPGNALLAKLVEKFLPGAGSTVESTVSSKVTSSPAPAPAATPAP